ISSAPTIILMQVLKFGGSSVANAENIRKVLSIVADSSKSKKTVVVVSALGGVTDTLLKAAELASDMDESYRETLKELESRHLEAVKQLMPVNARIQLLSLVKRASNEIEDICSGLFLLGELTTRSRDRIASYGEWIS